MRLYGGITERRNWRLLFSMITNEILQVTNEELVSLLTLWIYFHRVTDIQLKNFEEQSMYSSQRSNYNCWLVTALAAPQTLNLKFVRDIVRPVYIRKA